MKTKKENKGGISLIVLVITIIVMIILAGAIILSLSSSGIIGRTKQAKKVTDISNIKEAGGIHFAEYKLEVNTGDLDEDEITAEEYVKNKLRDDGYAESQLVNVKVHNDGTIDIYPAVIPEGFVISGIENEQKVDYGLVVYEIPEDERNSVDWTETVTVNSQTILKVQNEYNQYVWVPVPDIIKFVKKDWKSGITGAKFNTINDYDVTNSAEAKEYTQIMESVEKYGGFYIARYEAGKPDGDLNYGQTEDVELTVPLSKKMVSVWSGLAFDTETKIGIGGNGGTTTFGSWDNPGSAKVARNAYDTNVKSHIIYGFEWDAALQFISKNDNAYAKNSLRKGIYNVDNGLKRPGSDDKCKVNNIYDMAGNVFEVTMETYIYIPNSTGYNFRLVRGGDYLHTGTDCPAAFRTIQSPNIQVMDGLNYGFRVALYIK